MKYQRNPLGLEGGALREEWFSGMLREQSHSRWTR